MYCKQCGHRTEEKTDTCLKCGAKLSTALELGTTPRRKFRWRVVVAAPIVGVIVFVLFPRAFFRTELEFLGPTQQPRLFPVLPYSEFLRVAHREVQADR